MSRPIKDERIVLLSERGLPIGSAAKLESHHKNTPLHLAFSVYIFNLRGEILVTQRALHKKVWPGVWTNSCCGHPAPGESIENAIHRRVEYELGMKVGRLSCVLPNYRYKTPPYKGVIENEICPVYFARSEDEPRPNEDEVAIYRWLEWSDFINETTNSTGNLWSWWCKDQVNLLRNSKTVIGDQVS